MLLEWRYCRIDLRPSRGTMPKPPKGMISIGPCGSSVTVTVQRRQSGSWVVAKRELIITICASRLALSMRDRNIGEIAPDVISKHSSPFDK